MKIIICILLLFVFLVCFSACENASNNNSNVSITSTESAKLNSQDSSENGTKKEDNNTELFGTYKVPMKDIYIDTPNYQEVEQGYTEIYIVYDEKYVAVTTSRDVTAENPTEAHEKAFEKFIQNMQNFEGGVNRINIEEDKTNTINGIDVYEFKGKINYGQDNVYDGYAVGYSFVMDGMPCEIIGSVVDDSQSEELIQEIDKVVEAMMQSVRNKP